MSGNAYQFRFKAVYPIGTYIALDGPHDQYGTVYGHGDNIGNPRGTLHHIRGIGQSLPQGRSATKPNGE